MRTLDKHFKCPKYLKTMFALSRSPAWFKKAMMEAKSIADHTEYAIEPRSVKSTPTDERKGSPSKQKR